MRITREGSAFSNLAFNLALKLALNLAFKLAFDSVRHIRLAEYFL